MKKLFAFGCLCAAAAAVCFADTEIQCGNDIGLLKINNSTSTDVVIAVPFNELSTGSAVCVSNLVKTAGLAVNDMLYAYTPSTKNWEAWKLQESGGAKHWQSVGKATIVNGVPQVGETPNTAATTVVPGGALWIKRASASSEIYVYGAVVSGTISTSVSAGVRTLIANPKAETCTFDSGHNYTPSNGDEFLEPSGQRWKYKNEMWNTLIVENNKYKLSSKDNITLAQGEGGWLVTTADATINW